MSSDVLDSLARWVKTAPGRRWFEGVDREAKVREEAISERRALVARIADAKRSQREDLPKLHAVCEKADAVLKAATAEYDKARRARYEAGMTASSLFDRLHLEIRRAEGRLRVSCDPRLNEMQELLGDVWRDWDRTWDKLAIRETVGEFMGAYTRIVNKAELEALRQGVVDAHEAIEKFKQVAEPTEQEILAMLARGQAALDAIRDAGGGRGGEVAR